MTNLTPKLKKEINKLHTAHGRKKSKYYIIEGLRCCEEALSKIDNHIVSIITSDDYNGLIGDQRNTVVDCKEFNELSQTQTPQGIIILAYRPDFVNLKFSDNLLLILDRIQDPGNMGTILRTAIAVGLTEVVLTKGSVDPFNPKAIRSGMGAQFSLNFNYFDDLKSINNHDILKDRQVWLTTPHDGISCYDMSFDMDNSVLVFGEEANGICDFSVGSKTMIPTLSDIESLNVAQAATVYLFESLRQKIS